MQRGYAVMCFECLHGAYVDARIEDCKGGSLPSVVGFWQYAREAKPRSPLPASAIAVISIDVSTAACERYFSELALIHTARRNRMAPHKAAMVTAVRKRVREQDNDNKLRGECATRIINTSEPENVVAFGTPNRWIRGAKESSPYVRQIDSAVASTGEVAVEDESELLPDDVLEQWVSALFNLGEDEDADQQIPDLHANLPTKQLNVEQDANCQFPAHDDVNFPCEGRLCGLRAHKASLNSPFMVVLL